MPSSSFLSADANAKGSWHSSAPSWSASYSLVLDTASCRIVARIGVKITISMLARGLWFSSLLRGENIAR